MGIKGKVMNIEKLKSEFEQSECFKKLEHVAQYTFFEFGAYLKRTDVPDNVEKKCGHLITALILSWSAWKEAKAHADQKITQAIVTLGEALNDSPSNYGDAIREALDDLQANGY